MRPRHWLVIGLLAALPACSAGSSGTAARAADSVTKAVYGNDARGVASQLDTQLQSQVSRGEVGMLSDKMHALGQYKGLTYISGDPTKNEYTYRANFDKGSLNVVVRVDADGKLGAYRVFTGD
ncbi:MAG: hypothetical protein ACYDGM_02285 [Vulcanimicrobiaceae bacterium]